MFTLLGFSRIHLPPRHLRAIISDLLLGLLGQAVDATV
jgi:hypothetical protein